MAQEEAGFYLVPLMKAVRAYGAFKLKDSSADPQFATLIAKTKGQRFRGRSGLIHEAWNCLGLRV